MQDNNLDQKAKIDEIKQYPKEFIISAGRREELRQEDDNHSKVIKNYLNNHSNDAPYKRQASINGR